MERIFKNSYGWMQALILVYAGLNLAGCAKYGVNPSSKASTSPDVHLTDGGPNKTPDAVNDKAATPCFTDTFQVPPATTKPVDILFVVETSPSMGDIRQTITNGVNGFISTLPAGTDFNIAVMLSHGSTSALSGHLYRAEAEPLVLKTSQLTNAQIQTFLDAKLNQVPADTDSGGGEEGMFTLFHSITTPALLAEAQAADFFRPAAALSVVYIADRRDICAAIPVGVPPETDPLKTAARIRDCEGLTAAGLVNRLTLLKGSQAIDISGIIYAIDPAPTGKEIGYGYTDMIALKPGQAIDIAHDNIAAGLAHIIDLSGFTPGQNVFTLTHDNVDETTIKVTVNGQEAPFTFNAETNQVTVTTVVPPGATVVVTYCLLGDNPFVGVCKVFENTAAIDALVPAPSDQDVQIKNKSGGVSVDAARNLSIQNVSGGFTVQSAQAVSSLSSISGPSYLKAAGDIGSISNISGTIRIDKAGHIGSVSNISGILQLNANSLGKYLNASGNACIRALTIGQIQSTSGSKTLIANSIESLKVTSGTVDVFGATISSVENFSGKICLHNGAKILSYSNVSGFIGECN